ncbi:MAG: protein kinase [Pyrinomonadaceae bacterium]
MGFASKTRIGRYQIISALGKGGMGEVYLAEDTRLERKVALKVLRKGFGRESEKLNRFIQEAKAASALNHPNILTVYEIGQSGDVNFIATEYIDGLTIRKSFGEKSFSFDEIASVAVQTAEALAAAHASGIIHRDIKPENIMIRRDGYVKVLDFGLAKLIEHESPDEEVIATTETIVQTNPGIIMGTPFYMSPEQLRDRATDGRTDIWSLGVVMFEMITRKLPFEGGSVNDVIASILNNEPLSIGQFSPACPPELNRIITRALKKKRTERYPAMSELISDLKNLNRIFEREREVKCSVQTEEIAQPAGPDFISKETNKDALLLTEFNNLTGDPVFDGTLKLALAVMLEQSPYIDIFPEDQVRRTLKFMGRSPDETVTAELGREICQRRGLKAFVAGTIAGLGSLYLLTLEAVNSRTGEVIGRQLGQAKNKEEVIEILGQAASGLREKLGESLSSIEKFDFPLQYTSSSLEALKVYSLAFKERQRGEMLKSISLLEKTVEIDPGFAYAYVGLASNYGNINQWKHAAKFARRAYELRNSVSELERLRITFFYHVFVTGEIEKLIETLELWKQNYPRDNRVYDNLSDSYQRIGQFEKAIESSAEAIRIEPKNSIGHINLSESNLLLNRFEEAERICRTALEKKFDSYYFQVILFKIAFIKGDSDEMQTQLKWFRGRREHHVALNLQTGRLAFQGKWRGSREMFHRSIESALKSEVPETAGLYSSEQALRIAFWSAGTGLPRDDDQKLGLALKTQTRKALDLSRNQKTLSRAALALAFGGQTAEADSLVTEMEKEYPKDTLINHLWIPVIKGAVKLHQGEPEESLEFLEMAERYEKAAEFYPQYVRGLVYLRMKKRGKALVEFDKILENPGEAALSAVYPLARLGRARASEDPADYEKFFEMWSEADPDMPALIAARGEVEDLLKK